MDSLMIESDMFALLATDDSRLPLDKSSGIRNCVRLCDIPPSEEKSSTQLEAARGICIPDDDEGSRPTEDMNDISDVMEALISSVRGSRRFSTLEVRPLMSEARLSDIEGRVSALPLALDFN